MMVLYSHLNLNEENQNIFRKPILENEKRLISLKPINRAVKIDSY